MLSTSISTRFRPHNTTEYIKKAHPEQCPSKLNIQIDSDIDLSSVGYSFWTVHPIIELLKAGRFEPLKTLDSKTSLNEKIKKIASCITIQSVPAYQADLPSFSPGTPIEIPQIYFELFKNMDLAERAINFRLCRDFLYLCEVQKKRRTLNQFYYPFCLLSYASLISSIFMVEFERNTPSAEKFFPSPLSLFPFTFLPDCIYALADHFTKPNYLKSLDLDAMKITQDFEGAKYYLECKKYLRPSKKEHYDQRIRQLEENFHKKKVEVEKNFFSRIIEKIKHIFLKVFYFILCVKSTPVKDPFQPAIAT